MRIFIGLASRPALTGGAAFSPVLVGERDLNADWSTRSLNVVGDVSYRDRIYSDELERSGGDTGVLSSELDDGRFDRNAVFSA